MEKNDTQGIRVFVYGTLKEGRPNNDALRGADLLGRHILRGKYRMVNLGYYPGMVFLPSTEPDNQILGEVYRVSRDTLQVLDYIEGHPNYYARHKVTTPWKGAWCYFLPMAYKDKAEAVETVEGIQIWKPSDVERQYVSRSETGF